MSWEILSEIENMGGTLFFYFIEIDKILTIPRQYLGKIGLISLKNGNEFESGYAVPGSLELTIDQPPSDQGTVYDIVLSGDYPKPGAQMLAKLNDMLNRKYLVLCKDANGVTRVCGSLQEPLKFSYSEKTGKQASEKAMINFKFTGRSIKPPWHYSVDISAPAPVTFAE